jgi:hypothetical protein
MGKLFNLKEWLTVADAARHLSIVFGEDVTKADVLRLALDGHLRLSVDFVNHAQARCGKVARHTEAALVAAIESGTLPDDLEWMKWPKDLAAAVRGESGGEETTHLMSLRIDDDRYLTLGDDVTKLKGVWDLPMIGGEKVDIEHQYQMLTGGPSVTLSTLDGAFVEGRDGRICQLQEDFDDNEHVTGSSAQLTRLNHYIASNGIENDVAEFMLDQHEENRKAFLKRRRERPKIESYYPAGGLPKDAVLVVRTEALREFEQSVNGVPKGAEKPISTTERNTLLAIIAALCDYSAINPNDRGAASQIAKLTEEVGATVSDDTVRRWLKAIPDALAVRKK